MSSNRSSERPPASNGSTRVFEDSEAVRTAVPLMIGLMGPSGGGKTKSALRVATGIQRVSPGDIAVIDTESRRALHYAPKRGERAQPPKTFSFRHIPFGAPFGPLDYLAAIEYAISKGARTIIVDSMSHEHEGPGGVLEMHAEETKRLARLWKCSEDAAQMTAWGPPKSQRRRLLNSILQQECNFIFCFRAKEKLKIVKGEKPQPRGFMPIAGDEFVYEMVVCALLMPGAGGVPTWQSKAIGERMMIKLPDAYRALLLGQTGPLSEDIGEQLAIWAGGGDATLAREAPDPDDYVIPEGYARKLTGRRLGQLTPDNLQFLINDPKCPAPIKMAAERAFDARTSASATATDDDDDGGPPDFDPDTGEVNAGTDDESSDESDGEPADQSNEAPEGESRVE